ncbi:hypothetical protein PG984_003020 [Apiospora sp. TS-2023a]
MDINPIDNPEFFDPESRQALLFVVLSVLMAIATGVVGLRFYTRAVILGLIGLDDWLCLVSLGTILAFGGIALNLVTKGLGRHVGTLPLPEFHDYMKTFFVMVVFYNLAIASFKLCFLAQYYRIINSKTMRRLIFAATAFVGVTQVSLNIFQCTPVSGFWEPGPGVKCLPIVPGWYIAAAGNIVADILIILIPLPLIKGLNLPRAQKLALAGIFCLGFLTTAISLIRVKYLPQGIDTTWDNVDTTFWSMAECCTGILCVSLPTLRPLALRWFPRVFMALSRSTGGSSGRPTKSGASKSRPWQPKDLESRGGNPNEDGCGLRSAARRATKQWSHISENDQDEATLVTRTNATASVSRDHHRDGGKVEVLSSADRRRSSSVPQNYSRRGSKATWSQTRSQTPSQTGRKSSITTTTFLDSASEDRESPEIELHDISGNGNKTNVISYPMAVYSGVAGEMGAMMRTGHAVEISGGKAVASMPGGADENENSFIRVQQEVDVKGTAL